MIDWRRVQDLKDEIGADAFPEVVDLFLEETDEVMARLSPAARALEQDLHFLKSSALNLGFAQFADLCGSGELAAARGNAVDLTPIRAAYAASRAAFSESVP